MTILPKHVDVLIVGAGVSGRKDACRYYLHHSMSMLKVHPIKKLANAKRQMLASIKVGGAAGKDKHRNG